MALDTQQQTTREWRVRMLHLKMLLTEELGWKMHDSLY